MSIRSALGEIQYLEQVGIEAATVARAHAGLLPTAAAVCVLHLLGSDHCLIRAYFQELGAITQLQRWRANVGANR